MPTSYEVLTFTFTHNTAIISSHNNIASVEVNSYLKRMDVWFDNWRIRINELKSKLDTFTLRKGDCAHVFFYNKKLPQESKAVYLVLHL